MPPISVMVKPASSLCNMSCTYCFYHSLSRQRESVSYGMMSEKTVEEVIKKALAFANGTQVYLSFQGGEPLLRGIDFFEFVYKTVRDFNTLRSPVTLAMQTNGLLVDEKWCKLFKKADWLIGLSLDGDEFNNINRIDNAGNPGFDRTLAAAKLMQRFGVNFNILTVVTEQSAKNIANIYKFLTAHHFRYLQFIPCLKPFGSQASPLTIKENTYGDYLIELFKLYLGDIRRGRYVSVRQLDNLVLLAKGRFAEQCGMNGTCSSQFVVEGDGTVFPCDFYCLDAYRLGNVNDNDFAGLSANPVRVAFFKSSLQIKDECKQCRFFTLCRGGGCKREQSDFDKCQGYRKFLTYALPYIKNIY